MIADEIIGCGGKMKTILGLLILVSSSQGMAGERDLNPFSGRDLQTWISTMPDEQNVNTLIRYGESESINQNMSSILRADEMMSHVSPQPLFVGAHFIVDCDISTFGVQNLLSPQGIAALSGSEIQVKKYR